MTARVPERAMILAAGLGSRMGTLTTDLPKPLIPVGGRSLIDHALDRLQAVGVERVVVNLHYLGERIRAHLSMRTAPIIDFSEEPERLETGGGVAKALPLLGAEPFFVINADAFWLDGAGGTLAGLATAWDNRTMDALLLLHDVADAHGYDGRGDFSRDDAGRLTRRGDAAAAPWLFAGIQILHPRLFEDLVEDAPKGVFSLNRLYDRALAAGRLFGAVHNGEWFHVGTPAGLDDAETFLRRRG